MKSLCNLFMLFLFLNFYKVESSNYEKKVKPARPPFPIGHIPNFSKNNSSALSVFSPSLNSSSQVKKNLTLQEHQKKSVVISTAPLPICHENKPIVQLKSCLKQQVSQISAEQQKLRQAIFHKRKKLLDVSLLIHKKPRPCSDCFFKYNHLQCAFLCNHYL